MSIWPAPVPNGRASVALRFDVLAYLGEITDQARRLSPPSTHGAGQSRRRTSSSRCVLAPPWPWASPDRQVRAPRLLPPLWIGPFSRELGVRVGSVQRE